jgi:hypothetical protein
MFLNVLDGFAHGSPLDRLQEIVAQGAAGFRALSGGAVSSPQEIRAALVLDMAARMTDAPPQFSGTTWIRNAFHKRTMSVPNNGSPVIIRPSGMGRKADFAVIAMPGDDSGQPWRLYRREEAGTQGGYAITELSASADGLVHLGHHDTSDGVYGFTTLTGRGTRDPYGEYISDRHTAVEVLSGDLVVHARSPYEFCGTAVEYVVGQPLV